MSTGARFLRLPAGVWLAAGGAVGLLLATASRYGFHRDELYFLMAGRRLSTPWNVDNEEAGYPILLCRRPSRQLAEVWNEDRHYN